MIVVRDICQEAEIGIDTHQSVIDNEFASIPIWHWNNGRMGDMKGEHMLCVWLFKERELAVNTATSML